MLLRAVVNYGKLCMASEHQMLGMGQWEPTDIIEYLKAMGKNGHVHKTQLFCDHAYKVPTFISNDSRRNQRAVLRNVGKSATLRWIQKASVFLS